MMTSMLRRAVLLMVLFAMSSFSVYADEVTAADALQKAQAFANSHFARKGGAPKSKPASQIKALGQVSGLYVFGMSDAGGFVIVSNDDRTTPILGYSDSGTIDPNNMPDNMRAWLQGYAEEIAWLRANGTNEATQTNRTNRAARAEVSPLMDTKWNQDSPYNDLCPVYDANGSRSATGCVATAYAQVMYYTETTHRNTTTTTTAEIPGYTTKTKKIEMPAIPEGTIINWSNMVTDYSVTTTEEQDNAVANLMLLCGCAVQMNYNYESGAYTKDVATALKTYFGYAATTQYVSRSCYTYANWIDLIYNELSQGRPVVYSGQSTDRGHEFVCDGYQYVEGDLFHINWGWGGSSDGYFVLSVLNPDEQGIGGSPSSSAFTIGQEAVIGIQKIGDTGTVLNVPTTAPNNLTINSITLSHSTIALGESVNVRVNVTNNNSAVYDGEIYLSGISGLNVGDMFVIPAGETRDCDITFTPKEDQSYTLKAKYYADATTNPESTCYASLTVKNQTPTVIASSSVATESATISWNNIGDATKWNLRSKPVSMAIYDFSRFTSYWDMSNWITDETTGIGDSPCVKSETTDKKHWLVSPKIRLGGSFSFYAWKSADDDADEAFFVLYSTDKRTFYYLIKDGKATHVPTEYSVDLSDFSGEGYVAIIHHGGQTGKYLYVDDATIIEPAGDWTTVSDLTTNSYDLTGLTATPRYEVQVQAVNNDGGKWSKPYILNTAKNTLTLLNNDSEAATKNADLIKQWNGVTANVTLSGRTLYKDGDWNTICLPFDVTLAGSDLAGAEARELSSTVVYNGKTTGLDNGELTLNFSEPLDKLLAGKPYIIKWSKDVENPIINSPEFNGVTLQKCYEDFESNGVKFLGFEYWQEFENDDKSILFIGTENKLYWPMTGASLGAFRAYFKLTESATVREFNMNFDESTPTIIGHTEITEITEKADASWYTIDGVRLSGKPTQKGLYIYKGIKRVVK